MTLAKRLNEKIDELERRAREIREIQRVPASLKTQQEWLSLLTSYVFTLAEIHELDREELERRRTLA